MVGKQIWQIIQRIGITLLLLLVASQMTFHLWENGWCIYLDSKLIEEEAFRSMDFGKGGLGMLAELAEEQDCTLSETAAVWMIRYGYHLPSTMVLQKNAAKWPLWRQEMRMASKREFYQITRAYEAVLTDIACFPVGKVEGLTNVGYEDSWLDGRDYGGERQHEGCDIMSGQAPAFQYENGIYPPGLYPVVSVTDGTVEKMGWLPLGGWRIGIRSSAGGYFYYAHLHDYAPDLQEGSLVKAGQLLGWMGDSGYGEEGTTGQFPVHLHFGIYLQMDHFEELAVNPYWILRYLQEKQEPETLLEW